MQAMKNWYKSHPHLFVKSPRNHAGRDTNPLTPKPNPLISHHKPNVPPRDIPYFPTFSHKSGRLSRVIASACARRHFAISR